MPAQTVLVIGGNRFMGVSLVWRLLFGGHRVTLANRGNLDDPFGDRVERVRVDRGSDAFEAAFAGRAFDRVVDLAGFTADELARAVRTFRDRVGHYIFVSTGQVYLVRQGCPVPSREPDYDGPVMSAPPTAADHDDWAYGIGKRGAEDVLAAAPQLPSTRLRIPMVNGERDPKRRFDAYLWRLLDGGPLLVPRGDAIARHVYRGAVAETIAAICEAPPPPGHAYNLAQDELPTVRELVEMIAERAGASPTLIDVEPTLMEQAGLSVRAASPFSSRWMSLVDPEHAKTALGFRHPPLGAYLDSIVADLLATWPASPPDGHTQRPAELALAASL